jgi:diguanylate cyclase (GGDEF)-like protein
MKCIENPKYILIFSSIIMVVIISNFVYEISKSMEIMDEHADTILELSISVPENEINKIAKENENEIHILMGKIRNRVFFSILLGGFLLIYTIKKVDRIVNNLKNLSENDHLTKIFNRQGFEKRLKFSINEKRIKHLDNKKILLYLDLYHFKAINDNFGHNVGDEVLLNVSKIFKNNTRENDIIGRMGGDEFAILLKDCSLDNAQNIASKITSDVYKIKMIKDDKTFDVGVSIGITTVSQDVDVKKLFAQVDTACYQAKTNGRNGYKVN